MDQLLIRKRNASSVAEARDVSNEVIENFEETVSKYVDQLMVYNSNDIEATNGGYLTEEIVQCSFWNYTENLYTSLKPTAREFNESRQKQIIILKEKMSFVWSYYVFLVVTNKHFKYTPPCVRINGQLINFHSRSGVPKISKYSKKVTEALQELSHDLFNCITASGCKIAGAEVTLHFMIAFAGWIELIYDGRNHKNFGQFISAICDWCLLKERAKTAIKSEKEHFAEHPRWKGCIEWIEEMDFVNDFSSEKDQIIRRSLFDELVENPAW